jgi:hypothetical protein
VRVRVRACVRVRVRVRESSVFCQSRDIHVRHVSYDVTNQARCKNIFTLSSGCKKLNRCDVRSYRLIVKKAEHTNFKKYQFLKKNNVTTHKQSIMIKINK